MKELVLSALCGVLFIGYVAILSECGPETFPVHLPKTVKVEVPLNAPIGIKP